jgi:hypothetical protein
VGTLGGLLLLPASAAAQGADSHLRIDQLQPSSAFSPFTRAEGPHYEFDEGIEYAFRVTGDYMWNPLVSELVTEGSDETTDEVALVSHAMLLHVQAALVPVHWLNLGLAVPFALFETGDPNLQEVDPSSTVVNTDSKQPGEAGIGDGRLSVLFRPHTSDELDMSLGGRFLFPFGFKQAYMGRQDTFLRMEVVVAAAGEADSLMWGCTAGIAPLFFAGRDGDRLALSCAGHFNATPMFSFGLEPHFAMFTFAAKGKRLDWAPGFGESEPPGQQESAIAFQLEPLAAGRFHLSGFSVGVAAGPGIGNAPGTAGVRALLTVGYAGLGEPVVEEKPPDDSDLDGIPDDYDECPKEAGPEDRNGCPAEQDLDGDGIIEGDACPEQAGASYDDPEANGCPDRDNDRFADPVDPCPLEPGPRTEGCPKYARLRGVDGPGAVRFRVDPPIQFKKRSSKLSKREIETLREIVATMRANPKLEQISITVGAKRAKQKLTDARAKAILIILSEDQDFDSNRYEVVIGEDLQGGLVKFRVIQ